MLIAQKKPFSRNDSILLPELDPVTPLAVRAHQDGELTAPVHSPQGRMFPETGTKRRPALCRRYQEQVLAGFRER
jgi:hypothetical protein